MATRQARLPTGDGFDRAETTIETREDGKERCPNCNEWYVCLAQHWSMGSCPHPPISDYKMELLKGMMMGDGSFDSTRKNPRFGIDMTNNTFLHSFSEELGWLASDVGTARTAVEQAKVGRKGLNSDMESEDTHDLYYIRTRTHPEFERFDTWYDTEGISFPDGLTVSPSALLMWYISDGGLVHDSRSEGRNSYIQFSSQNESERPNAIVGALEDHGFTVGHSGDKFLLSTEDTEDFFDLIGHEPVLGFEYKWCWKDTERYDEMKELCERAHTTQTLE